jgi:hypothetical protein
MLAYMDDILEPEDAADIGKKLEESDLAKGIMHRLRDSIRRLRLGAPPALGHGMGLDPNSVAEYLDNTLPAEQVGEFEKICLESDVHLAEVGACHQILTLVLGEPAEVDAAARERMYHIAARTAVPQAAPAPFLSPVSTSGSAAAQPARRAKPEVPDYLRQPPSRNWVAIAAILILVLISGGFATMLFLPELRKMVGNRGDEIAGNNTAAGEGIVDDSQPGPPGDEQNSAAPTDLSSGDSTPDNPGIERTIGSVAPSDDMPDRGTAMPAENPSAPDALPEPDAPAGAPVVGADVPQPSAVAGVVPPATVLSGTAPPVAVTPDETPTGEVLGRYPYKQDVLLRLDRGTGLWRRLPATPALVAGDRLMTLAGFRPKITLISDVTIQPVDASRFELLGLDESGVPMVGLNYGRLVLYTAGKPNNPIRVRLGDHQALITFIDGESILAIDARRLWIPGKDPAAAAGPPVADLFVTSGAVTWEEAGVRSEWRAPQHAVVDVQGVRLVDTEIAKWTRGEAPKGLELGAAETVEHELTSDQPVSLSVKELLSYRKSEVRALAIRAAANVGEFELLVKMLNDPDQKLLWHLEIEALRSAMARDPETAQLIQAAFETRRGADGLELYRMLWGYSSEDVAGGVMNKLVEYLNNDEWIDLRVLAFQNLHDITGKNLLYKPEASSAVRRPAYLKWKERIKEFKPAPGG